MAQSYRNITHMPYSMPPAAPSLPPAAPSAYDALQRSRDFLLRLQSPDGYWWAELESNVTLTSELIMLYYLMGIESELRQRAVKAERYLRRKQRLDDHGGWETHYGDGGTLSMTVEAYIALRLLGVPASDTAMRRAREFILSAGGASGVRIFTQICLACGGLWDWAQLPCLPPFLMMFPTAGPFSIYSFSSWARSAVVPLIVVFDQKPVFPNLAAKLRPLGAELFLPESSRAAVSLSSGASPSFTDRFFLTADRVLKLGQRFNLLPFRQRGLDAALRWVMERQEESGDWAGIFPPMLFSVLCYLCAGFTVDDPIVRRALDGMAGFSVETDAEFYVQACLSPVWDTALVVRALGESGIDPAHPAMLKAARWLLDRQIFHLGDWSYINAAGARDAGGWAFEFFNKWYPDVDDTAMVVMALNAVLFPDAAEERRKEAAMSRAARWVASMQCKAGGWAAFDKDNDQEWLNRIPMADLKGMNDPNTADVTARVVEMVGNVRNYKRGGEAFMNGSGGGGDTAVWLPEKEAVEKGMKYLREEQEEEGCWYGRWGVNYIYGTCGVLVALGLTDPAANEEEIQKGAEWLVSVQNEEDGGWGEACESYGAGAKGKGKSTASQTAWALMGLLAAGDVLGKYEVDAVEAGVAYLVATQSQDGSWYEPYFTGTGFPNHFMLRYHLYPQHFPLTALSRYLNRLTKLSAPEQRNGRPSVRR